MHNVLADSTPLLRERLSQYRVVARQILAARRHDEVRRFSFRIQSPDPALFGGYLRDTLLDATPVDMDVQIFDARWIEPNGWRKLDAHDMAGLSGDSSFVVRLADYDYGLPFQNTVTSVGYYAVDGVDVPVNIVKAKTRMSVDEMLEAPDFGINQCLYYANGTGHVMLSKPAEYDLAHKTMTWNAKRGLDELARSKRRAERITARLAAQGVHLTVDFSAAKALERDALENDWLIGVMG